MDFIIEILIIMIMLFVFKFVKLKYDMNKVQNILKWVVIAVKAAEQVFTEPKSGSVKKQNVMDFILNKFNNKIKENELDNMIESAVYDMNNNK